MRVSRAIWVVGTTALLLTACGSGSTDAGPTTSLPPSVTGSSMSMSGSSSGSAGSAAATTRNSGATASAGSSAAELEQYCAQSGGQVQNRAPFWNTNGDRAQWLALARSATMCRFQADHEAKSRIYVDLITLSSTEPTLAGLAYLSKVPMQSSTGGANPATGYCSNELHGSSTFGGGAGAAGGGWVAQDDPDDVVVSLCVFPDGSYIDEWGLAYHSAGEVRGKDLSAVMRYQPAGALPPVFPVAQVQPTS